MNGIPRFIKVKQSYPAQPAIEDVRSYLNEKLEALPDECKDLKGKVVGITGGSRGITSMVEITRTTVDFIKSKGGIPVIFGAMGSHGGGTAEGQREILASLGITEESMGCEIRTCGECKEYGRSEKGFKVIANKLIEDFDKIVVINRVKVHTNFEGEIESGLFKMMAIGMGNPAGCQNVHRLAVLHSYVTSIEEAGFFMLKHFPIAFGVAIVESWKHEVCRLEAVAPKDFFPVEKELLAEHKANMVRLPMDEGDGLMVEYSGKNVSGGGMDSKVVGRLTLLGQPPLTKPYFKRLICMRLTPESHGNGIGLGACDMIPRSLFESVNIPDTTLNSYSAVAVEYGGFPCIFETDYDTIYAMCNTVGIENTEDAKICYILDTNHLQDLWVSETMYEDIKDNPYVTKMSEPFDLEFDANGKLLTRMDYE